MKKLSAKAKPVRYEYGRKLQKHKKRAGLPTALIAILLLGFGIYSIWANFIPNPVTVFRRNTEKIAANIINDKSAEPAQENQAIDPSAIAPKTQKIKRKNKELNQQLAVKTRAYEGVKWSIYVEDIDSGVMASVDSDHKYSFAEVSRLALLPGIESKISPDRWRGNWFGKTITDCVNVGLAQANDACYDKIAKYVAQPQAQKSLNEAGYNMTINKDLQVETSTEKMASYLADMKRGQVLQGKTRRTVFDALYVQKQTPGLPLGCGDCRVANKQGKSGNAVIDAGIVSHGARNYVVVIVAEGGTFDQITDIVQTIDKYMKP